ncbi:hypothetical protein D3C80_801380 [compost metagenome]
MIAGQHGQQQVEHRHAAARGQAIAIPVEQVTGGDDLRKALGEIILPAPVHSRAITVEQTQLRQRVNTGRQTADHTTGTHQLLERTAERRRQCGRWFVSEQEQFLEVFELAGPRLTRQLPGAFARRFGLQERQLVNHVRMHTLGNTQGLLSQRKRQCFSAGPNQETNSMGSHGRAIRSEEQ